VVYFVGGGNSTLAISVLALCVSCNDHEEPAVGSTSQQPIVVSDIIRLPTIGDLEQIPAERILGENSGYEISSLTYECVDTIEMRALLFDVTATLRPKAADAPRQDTTVKFSAEVGPELVSVEYYPCGEMEAAHDNMYPAFYPKVERYRNYSDGSRIGPDKFYDYGHPAYLEIQQASIISEIEPYRLSFENNLIPDFLDSPFALNPEHFYYENETFYTSQRALSEINMNAVIKAENGETFKGEDFLVINPGIHQWSSSWVDRYDSYKYDFYGIDEYGYKRYRPSIIYEDATFVDCSGIPDKSPTPFPEDTGNLAQGWYYALVNPDAKEDPTYNSKYLDFILDNQGYEVDYYAEMYLQYLVIDGRVIHFVDLCDLKFHETKMSVTRNSDGYLCHTEVGANIYGRKFKAINDLQLKTIYGEHVEYDYRDYYQMSKNDSNIMDDLTSRSSDLSGNSLIERKDGKAFEMNKALPASIRSIPNSGTINK